MTLSGHPYERFQAPSAIEAGKSLAGIVGRPAVTLIAESLAPVVPGFNRRRFVAAANRGLEALGLMERGAHVGQAIRAALPDEPAAAMGCLTASLGPKLARTQDNGLKPFFYLPHSACIAGFAGDDFNTGMHACYELTQRFTAEFCLRDYLILDQGRAIRTLEGWIDDENPHVRRLVSEGTRPRLPWGKRLQSLVADPSPVLPLLERLKDDPELYVRRSVANHLGDIAKADPQLVYRVCRRWLKESKARTLDAETGENRRWMIRHALRHPWKNGDPAAIKLRQDAGFIKRTAPPKKTIRKR